MAHFSLPLEMLQMSQHFEDREMMIDGGERRRHISATI